MTVYVDDAGIPAEVRNGPEVHRSRWSHLTADTPEELHAFAARLGLRREWFQPGEPTGGKPSPFWHYDLTAAKRAQAIAMGAVGLPTRGLARYCRARAAHLAQVCGDTRGGRGEDANPRHRAAPQHPCPACGTAELTHGRRVCQACGLLRILGPSPERAWPDRSHGNPGHMCLLPTSPAMPGIEAGS